MIGSGIFPHSICNFRVSFLNKIKTNLRYEYLLPTSGASTNAKNHVKSNERVGVFVNRFIRSIEIKLISIYLSNGKLSIKAGCQLYMVKWRFH